jgi:hypothetical protein
MLKTRHRERLLLGACLETLQPFVIDNTNPTVDERSVYIRTAKQARFSVVGYYFESKAADALQRNEARPAQQQVPAVGILGTRKKLQLPSMAEGFDRLWYVRIASDGNFLTQEWQP